MAGTMSATTMNGTGLFGNHSAQRRPYDMCMVFKCKVSRDVQFDETEEELIGRRLRIPAEQQMSQMLMWKVHRESILKSLENCGLDLYNFYSRDRDQIICKIGANAAKLKDVAARMKYKLQLKSEYMGAYAEYRHDFAGRPELQFTDRRVVSHIYNSHTPAQFHPTEDAIFADADKVLLVHHMITSKDKECAGINVGNLLHNGEINAYFPLHEEVKLKELADAHWWTKFVMDEEYTHKIREYFGDRVAFYFLFMSFYGKWLIPIALIGVVKQLLDMFAMTPDSFTATHFCVLLSIWSVLMPHFWKRQEAKYAVAWGTLDSVEALEPYRPEHWGEPRLNPVTAEVEPFYPVWSRTLDYARSIVVVNLMGALVCLTMCFMLFYRHTHKSIVPGGIIGIQFGLAAVVELMNILLGAIAEWLTSKENHRTQSEHDKHLLVKLMALKFLNSFFALYYIGFYKNKHLLFGAELHCINNDCLIDVDSQLAVFVIFRLVFQNMMGMLTPLVNSLKYKFDAWIQGSSCWRLVGATKIELADMSNAEKEGKRETYTSFTDFDETLITHGYATLFVVACPWVCFATLVATIIEMWVDMNKIIKLKQRPLPRKARSAEPWGTAFEIYGIVAAFTNFGLLIFASEQYASWSTTEKLVYWTFLEHLVFMARVLINRLFPEVPHSVTLLQLKQAQLTHRLLENIKVEPAQDYSLFRDNGAASYEVFGHDYLEDEDADNDEPSWDIFDSGQAMFRGLRTEAYGAVSREGI